MVIPEGIMFDPVIHCLGGNTWVKQYCGAVYGFLIISLRVVIWNEIKLSYIVVYNKKSIIFVPNINQIRQWENITTTLVVRRVENVIVVEK